MSNSVYIVDTYNKVYNDCEQYGSTCATYEEAVTLFAEAVHAVSLDDAWNGLACVAEDDEVSLVIREIKLPN